MDIVAVDSHAHVLRRDAPLAPDRHSGPKRDCSIEEYLAVLDAHGMSHGVLTAPSFYGSDNSLLLDALDRAAGRLRGTVIVAPDIDRAALEAMAKRGAVGVRLNWFRRASLRDVASPEYRRLFATVRDLGWHVEIYLEGPLLANVLPTIRKSGANVVVDHFGSPAPRVASHALVFSACSKACAPATPSSSSPGLIGKAAPIASPTSTRCSMRAGRSSSSGQAIGPSCRTRIM